jgi:hypothetical protein
MSEQDLRQRMQFSVDAYLDDAVIDPAADLLRGRRRLVRRRATIGVIATAAAVVAAIGFGAVTIPSADNAPVSTPTFPPPVAQPPDAERDRVAGQLQNALLRHVAADLRVTTGLWGIGAGGFDKQKRSVMASVDVTANWEVGDGHGVAWAMVSQPGYEWEKDQRCGSRPLEEGAMPYRCSTGKAPDGRPIVLGVATITMTDFNGVEHRGVRGYFVRYTRTDGQIVDVGVDGADLNSFYKEKLYPPVKNPQVTFAQLIAAATDPEMTLK